MARSRCSVPDIIRASQVSATVSAIQRDSFNRHLGHDRHQCVSLLDPNRPWLLGQATRVAG